MLKKFIVCGAFVLCLNFTSFVSAHPPADTLERITANQTAVQLSVDKDKGNTTEDEDDCCKDKDKHHHG